MKTNRLLSALVFALTFAAVSSSRGFGQVKTLTLGIAVRCPYGLTG